MANYLMILPLLYFFDGLLRTLSNSIKDFCSSLKTSSGSIQEDGMLTTNGGIAADRPRLLRTRTFTIPIISASASALPLSYALEALVG